MNLKDITKKGLDDIIRDEKKRGNLASRKKGNQKKPFTSRKDSNRGRGRGRGFRGRRIGKGPRGFIRPLNDRRRDSPPPYRGYRREPPRRRRPEDLRERMESRRNNEYPSRRPVESQNKLFVDNLPMKFTSDELNELFSEVGYLTKCKLVMDDFGKSKGRAVVMYENSRDAERAIEKFNENKLDGKIISVEFAPGRGRDQGQGRFNGHDSRIERRGSRGEREGAWRSRGSRRY